MATLETPEKTRESRFGKWLLRDQPKQMDGPQEPEEHVKHQHSWWQVMCLTGVDYFSTLGYQPGIAALAAGFLSPIATLILVFVTLFGALPIYRRVAQDSPYGEGSISMLERLLPWWQGKLFVLVLLGFVATDFTITITLSAADATAHIIENPFVPHGFSNFRILLTLGLIGLLGAVFLKGFSEAIGIAVALVTAYLGLNLVVVVASIIEVVQRPVAITNWREALFRQHGSVWAMIGISLLLFPRLALGLSGFETGVAVMPLVQGSPEDSLKQPIGRITNTRKLLTTAACIMSIFLIATSFTTTVLIPPAAFQPGGEANGRALAYVAHRYLGSGFGTVYDVSTILILWFAGASAMAGLLNIVPRYLPRYGMAPTWTAATRPLVLIFTAIAFTITVIFHADVDAQGGAYATGVLVLITSASVAVAIAARRKHQHWKAIHFAITVVIFVYTTIVNIFERPDGVKIASFFIMAIIVTSLVSRIRRTTELRVSEIKLDDVAEYFVRETVAHTTRIIANKPLTNSPEAYRKKEIHTRVNNNIPEADPVLFLEVIVKDASDFAPVLSIHGEDIGGYRVLRMEGSAVANNIAAFLLYLRDRQDARPHAYFDWSEGNPLVYLLRYFFYGGGDVAPLTHEVLREAEPDPKQRPIIHVG